MTADDTLKGCQTCGFVALARHGPVRCAVDECAVDESAGDGSDWPTTRAMRAADGRCGPEGRLWARAADWWPGAMASAPSYLGAGSAP